MNIRLVIFSGLVTSVLGCILGIAAAEMGGSGYYKNVYARYAGVGAAQESIRQLKIRTEREDF